MKAHAQKVHRSQVSSRTPTQRAMTFMVTAVVEYGHGTDPGPTVENLRVYAAPGPDSDWNTAPAKYS